MFISFWLRWVFVPVHGLSLAAACGILSCGFFCCRAQAPGHAGSVVVRQGLSCPEACGILVPGTVSLALAGGFFFSFSLFIFGCAGSLLLCAVFSLVAASWGYSLLWCTSFSMWWLLLWLAGSRCVHAWVISRFSRIWLCDPIDCMGPARLLCPWDSLGRNTGGGCMGFSNRSTWPQQLCLEGSGALAQ